MATSEENDLIGYDPLAWMEGGIDKSEEHLLTDEGDSGSEQRRTREQLPVNNDIIINDYPENLVENFEESAILSDLNDAEQHVTEEDQLGIDEIEEANDSAVIEDHDDDSIDTGAVVDDAESEKSAGAQIDLDSTLTIQNVVKLHEKLKNSLAVHDQIEINASDVASIDTATLQLLVSLKKDAAKLQKQVSIIYPSPRFVESAQLLGLLDVLDVHGV